MTASHAHRLRFPRRPLALIALALAVGLAAGVPSALAAAPATSRATQAAPVQIANIDFKRGDDGSGRLILKFDRSGAAPDMRNEDGRVVVDVSNVVLPAQLQRTLDVVDFATPVQRVDAHPAGNGAQLVLATRGGTEALAYQLGNEFVVEVSAKASRPAMGAAAAAGSSATAAAAAKPYTGKPATFNFQDVPVRTVLQLIAEESNLNVVASDTVQGNVTLRLVNVPWDQALDIVLRAKGLDKRRDGNVVWVAPQPELAKFEQDKEDARIAIENREDLITDYVQINYHSAADIYKELTEAKSMSGQGTSGSNQENGFLSPRGRLVADERTNTLMISDIPKKVARMRELINVIDRPVDQVLIEGRIVIATDTFARDLGASFGVGGSRSYGGNTATVGSSISGDANATRSLNFSGSDNTYTSSTMASLAYTLLGTNFNLELELAAMQEEGRGEILSNPRVVTSNQQEALIKQGKQVAYVTYSSSTSGVSTPTVQFKDVVMQLKVKPTITDDDRVSMTIDVTKDDIDEWMTVTGYGAVPIINTREITTNVLVDNGQTVVIGGIYEFTDQQSVAKVPFLGDIPFLGNLFKRQGKDKEKAELLVFITPQVMRVKKN
ncbi:MAG: type IV pilus secretin PilQ family protein [Pseudoxanthomonas sp.]